MATPIIPPTPPIIAPRGRRSSILCCSASQEIGRVSSNFGLAQDAHAGGGTDHCQDRSIDIGYNKRSRSVIAFRDNDATVAGFRQYQRRRQIDSASQRLSDNLFFRAVFETRLKGLCDYARREQLALARVLIAFVL